MKICSLFSGIGGFELGLSSSGHDPVLFCEIDSAAASILKKHFSGVRVHGDIRTLEKLPKCDIVTAGWPCQDLSQAGQVQGLSGDKSSLITEVFRLIRHTRSKPQYILLENVAFSLSLHGGAAIKFVTEELEKLGYNWAYRVLDTRHFGKPQRRRRVFVLASLDEDPLDLFFQEDECRSCPAENPQKFGFYWTEGNRGLGWSPECIPPLKGGSGLSIPSPPAVWDSSSGAFISPGIADAEMLQGFPRGWTRPMDRSDAREERHRWTLVGNAVSVPVARWLGRAISRGKISSTQVFLADSLTKNVHNAGVGGPGQERRTFRTLTEGPASHILNTLTSFSFLDSKPVSRRAIQGFTQRLLKSNLRQDDKFVRDLKAYCS